MNQHSSLPPDRQYDESRELEQALATLRPNRGALDRDRLMFLAGKTLAEREAAQRGLGGSMLSQWVWPGATAASVLTAAVLGMLLAISHRPLVVREQVYIHTPVQPGSTPFVHPDPQPETDSPMGAPAPGSFDGEDQALADASATSHRQQAVELAFVDYRPRTTLPQSSYLHKRQVALSLGVEALGAWNVGSGSATQPLAYRPMLNDMMTPKN
jgi:hypothetical protein